MKSKDFLKNLSDKSVAELKKELNSLLREQLSYRMQIAVGEFKQTHLLRENRRNMARIKTLISQLSKQNYVLK